MIILGINAYHGDSSACLIINGKMVCAIEEERIRRIKHWAGFPSEAIKACLKAGDITIKDVNHVGVSRNPFSNLDEKIFYIISGRPSYSQLLRDRLENVAKTRNIKNILVEALGVRKEAVKAKFHSIEHHIAHMASAFLVSDFDSAAILSIDGFGDFRSAMWGTGKAGSIKMLNKVTFPHSLGILYTALTQYLGFMKYGDEYKVMGLAPYGRPVYLDILRKIVTLNKDGTYELDLDYFVHHKIGANMTWEAGEPVLDKLYSDKLINELGEERHSGSEITQRHKDIAASLQAFLEEAELSLLNTIYKQTKLPNLCIAGGVGFNSVANGKILKNTPFKGVFIQPAAGDAGTALGAAYYIYNTVLKHKRNFVMEDTYLGNEYTDKTIEEALVKCGLKFTLCRGQELFNRTAGYLACGKIAGWFQGKMEFGPRALGNRSILADPRNAGMKDALNARVKNREEFRPYAPAVLEEDAGDYFEDVCMSPYMLMVFTVKKEKREIIPAVTHCDGSSRIQTVSKRTNPRFWSLLQEFKKLTGVPVLLNTSFNENEPIVYSPTDAIDCFLRTNMDILVLGNYLVVKP